MIKKQAKKDLKGLEFLLMLLVLKEQQKTKTKKAKKKAKKAKPKEQEEGIESKVKKAKEHEPELRVFYGDPLQEVQMLDHTKLFSYLGNSVKVAEYKDDFYGDKKVMWEANNKTIDISDAYDIIREKKKEDMASGGASASYKLRKDYEAFQYWNLFNRALNIALYDVINCVGVSTPSELLTTSASH